MRYEGDRSTLVADENVPCYLTPLSHTASREAVEPASCTRLLYSPNSGALTLEVHHQLSIGFRAHIPQEESYPRYDYQGNENHPIWNPICTPSMSQGHLAIYAHCVHLTPSNESLPAMTDQLQGDQRLPAVNGAVRLSKTNCPAPASDFRPHGSIPRFGLSSAYAYA